MRLLDFGLALIEEAETLTAVGDVPGTLAYISPERLAGEQAGPAADVWAVGVMLWEALAGCHPFWTASLLETAKRIEEGAPSLARRAARPARAAARAVDRALALDPRARPTRGAARRGAARRPPRRAASRSGARRAEAPDPPVPPQPLLVRRGCDLRPLAAAVRRLDRCRAPVLPRRLGGRARRARRRAHAPAPARRARVRARRAGPAARERLARARARCTRRSAVGWLALSWREPRAGSCSSSARCSRRSARSRCSRSPRRRCASRVRRAARPPPPSCSPRSSPRLRDVPLPLGAGPPPPRLGIAGSDSPSAVADALAARARRRGRRSRSRRPSSPPPPSLLPLALAPRALGASPARRGAARRLAARRTRQPVLGPPLCAGRRPRARLEGGPAGAATLASRAEAALRLGRPAAGRAGAS